MKIYKFFFLVAITLSLFSCGDDELVLPPKYVPKGAFDSGVLILNQGNSTQNATLSYMSFDLNIIKNNILSGISTNPNIGQNASDIGFNEDLAYVVSTTDNKIEIVNRYSMSKVGTITIGLNNPRYIAIANGKAFVSNWGNPTIATDDFVAVIDLSTNLVVNSIAVLEGPGRILSNNGKLYIAQTGGTNIGSNVIVINQTTNTVSNIGVAFEPNTMQIDNGSLWVLCEGDTNPATETTGSLYKISLSTNQFTDSYQFPTRLSDPLDPNSAVIYQHPSNLYITGTDVIYAKGNGVYKMSLIPVVTGTNINAAVVYPTQPKFSVSFSTIKNLTIRNSYLYICGYDSLNSNGFVSVHSNGNQDLGSLGTLLKTQNVGINPNGFYFNL